MSDDERKSGSDLSEDQHALVDERANVVKIPMASLLGGIGSIPDLAQDVEPPVEPGNIMDGIIRTTEKLVLRAGNLRANVGTVVAHFVGPHPLKGQKEATDNPGGFLFAHKHVLDNILDDLEETNDDLMCLISAIRK